LPKQLSKFIRDELKLHGWENIGRGSFDGYIYASAGMSIHIVPSRMGKMYHLTKTKMSETTSTFVTEEQLLQHITEGETK
jgi:hypothetical protein